MESYLIVINSCCEIIIWFESNKKKRQGTIRHNIAQSSPQENIFHATSIRMFKKVFKNSENNVHQGLIKYKNHG